MAMHSFSIAIFSYFGHQHLLPFCLKSIYKNVPQHDEILLIWDDNVDWDPIDFDQLRQDTKLDFRLVYQSELYGWPDSIVRWGWIKQQLAKLCCHKICHNDNLWIVDGDVLVTGDPELFDSDQPILRHDNQRVVPQDYQFFMRKYLGIEEFNEYSYVGSTCLFQRDLCQELDYLCKKHSGMDLVSAVDHMLTTGSYPALPFSEFECYGHLASKQKHYCSKAQNWNYVTEHKSDWHAPIQIAWADTDPGPQNLVLRYQNLMRHRDPSTVDQ